jgi:hypothetical protein
MLSDVLETGGGGTTDFAGNLVLDTTIRITDALSGPSQLTPATVRDAQFAAPISCVPTPVVAGSNCSVDTTADTIAPNFARERSRTILSLRRVRILDPGPDGSLTPAVDPVGLGCPPTCGSGDEAVFMDQGVVAP